MRQFSPTSGRNGIKARNVTPLLMDVLRQQKKERIGCYYGQDQRRDHYAQEKEKDIKAREGLLGFKIKALQDGKSSCHEVSYIRIHWTQAQKEGLSPVLDNEDQCRLQGKRFELLPFYARPEAVRGQPQPQNAVGNGDTRAGGFHRIVWDSKKSNKRRIVCLHSKLNIMRTGKNACPLFCNECNDYNDRKEAMEITSGRRHLLLQLLRLPWLLFFQRMGRKLPG